jgi:ketosteroid isomerase-like protein
MKRDGPLLAKRVRAAALGWTLAIGATMMLVDTVFAGSADDINTVMTLDVEYQAAVERGDVKTMDRILADNFQLVTGAGKRFSKADLIEEARAGKVIYDVQRASERTAKVWGDTAVVTALLHARGSQDGKPFEYRVWYSDTYLRMSDGWRYVFGQSSLPLPSPKP